MNDEFDLDIDELNLSIAQGEDDIVELQKAIALSEQMASIYDDERFKTLFIDGFVKSYRDTAVVNIGLVRGDAQDGIKIGLIGRAQFESYCLDLKEALVPLKEQLKATEEELSKDKRVLAEWQSREDLDDEE